MNEWINRWMDGFFFWIFLHDKYLWNIYQILNNINLFLKKVLSEWMNEQMNEWMNEWMNKWMDFSEYLCIINLHHHRGWYIKYLQ